MQLSGVMGLSLGEWVAICRQWNKAHGSGKAPPPSEDEFEQAVMRARGVS